LRLERAEAMRLSWPLFKDMVEMAQYIARKAGLTDLTKATPKSRKDFNLWHLRLK